MSGQKLVTPKKSGRVVTVFLVIAVVLLITGTAMALFFQQLEMRERLAVETQLAKTQTENEVLRKTMEDLKRQVFLLEDKNKEADDRVNSLLDELDLEKGLREEMRGETVALRASLDAETQAKKVLEEQLVKARGDYEKRVKEIEDKLRLEVVRATQLEVEMEALKNKAAAEALVAASVATPLPSAPQDVSSKVASPASLTSSSIDLEQIVVVPTQIPQGRVLNVDTDTEFVIINLGRKDGVAEGMFFSIYRGQDYLGDVKVTRVQKEMSAADLIPPFTSRLVRQNDQVVVK